MANGPIDPDIFDLYDEYRRTPMDRRTMVL